MLRRRDLLKLSTGVAALSLFSSSFLSSTASFASEGEAKLIVVNLRGALDGLSAVPAIGDPDFASLRGGLAPGKPGSGSGSALELTSFFALHPRLSFLHELYGKDELTVFHSFASPYRARSHFSGQDVLANGTATTQVQTGWLNRALFVERGTTDRSVGISVGAVAPFLLRGPASVSSWSRGAGAEPTSIVLGTLEDLYAADPGLAPVWAQARSSDRIVEAAGAKADKGLSGLSLLLASAGRFLGEPGLQVAVVEYGGWDTHSRQLGRLDTQLQKLDDGLRELANALGSLWSRTVVIVMTEFGRTPHINGTGGTDHGTASAAFLLGGAVRGGRVIADWRGLRPPDLFEGRDLYPTGDLRSIFKGVLHDHFGLSEARLEDTVFPDSRDAKPIGGLIRI